jgi:hypothetical protein
MDFNGSKSKPRSEENDPAALINESSTHPNFLALSNYRTHPCTGGHVHHVPAHQQSVYIALVVVSVQLWGIAFLRLTPPWHTFRDKNRMLELQSLRDGGGTAVTRLCLLLKVEKRREHAWCPAHNACVCGVYARQACTCGWLVARFGRWFGGVVGWSRWWTVGAYCWWS